MPFTKRPCSGRRLRCSVLICCSAFFLAVLPSTAVSASSQLNSSFFNSLSAKKTVLPFQNPEKILITHPSVNYSTTASKISILGACDYRYPLYLDGEVIETTEYGFFTCYVSLKLGKNTFTFKNNGQTKKVVINRKESSKSSGSTASPSYKKYNSVTYGTINTNYAMPRTKVSTADVDLLPLTKGTTFQILGEQGNYYKAADGTFISKSSVTVLKKAPAANKVRSASVSGKSGNVVTASLTMDTCALYSVKQNDSSVSLTLYNTVSGSNVKVAQNDLVKSATVQVDKKANTTTYTFHFYSIMDLCGYDVFFEDNVLQFQMKPNPKLTSAGSLKGAVVLLDAGHGDSDSGASGPLGTYGPLEKDINLSITLHTKDYLENLGAKVVLVRDDDSFLSLSERVNLIRTVKPDISVSIHGNSVAVTSDFSKSSGFLTFYSYDYFLDVPAYINEKVCEEMGFTVRAPRQSNLSLTRLTACPAVLLETSFLSNPNDYDFLIRPENQKAFGEAIGSAISSYLTEHAQPDFIQYTIKRGDTLSSIARKYSVSLSVLAEVNHIENINRIIAGKTLLIPQDL